MKWARWWARPRQAARTSALIAKETLAAFQARRWPLCPRDHEAVAAAQTFVGFAAREARRWCLPKSLQRLPHSGCGRAVRYTPSRLAVCLVPPCPVQVGQSPTRSGKVRRLGHGQRGRCLVVLHDFCHHGLAAALEYGAVFDHELLRAAQTYEVGVDLRHDISGHEVPA